LQHGKLTRSSGQRGEADGATNNTPAFTDRSPLIHSATSPPPLIADATAFYNAAAAIAEPPQETASASGHVIPDVDRKLTESPPEVGRNVVDKESTPTSRPANASSKKKRKVLSIVSSLCDNEMLLLRQIRLD